jgi:Uma2 family endonuclease
MMAANIDARDLRVLGDDNDTVVDLRPIQGLWTEKQYPAMTEHSRRLLEFDDGYIKVLPMPTDKHQAISQFIFLALLSFIECIGGKVQYAPLRLQIRSGKHREPDIMLVCDANDSRRQNRYWLGADLVAEIVSPDDPERDTKVKRADYAEAGIPEYRIIDPEEESITVLRLEGDTCTVSSGVTRLRPRHCWAALQCQSILSSMLIEAAARRAAYLQHPSLCAKSALRPALFRIGSERCFVGKRLRVEAAHPLGWQIAAGQWLRGGAPPHVLCGIGGRMGRAAKLDGTGSQLNCINQNL